MCTIPQAEISYGVDVFYHSLPSVLALNMKELNCNFPCLTFFKWIYFHKNWGIQSNRQLSRVKSSNSYENKKVFVAFSITAPSALSENTVSVTQWCSCMKTYAQKTEGCSNLSAARHITASICTSCQTNEYECQRSLDLFSVIQL